MDDFVGLFGWFILVRYFNGPPIGGLVYLRTFQGCLGGLPIYINTHSIVVFSCFGELGRALLALLHVRCAFVLTSSL